MLQVGGGYREGQAAALKVSEASRRHKEYGRRRQSHELKGCKPPLAVHT